MPDIKSNLNEKTLKNKKANDKLSVVIKKQGKLNTSMK